MMAAACMAVAVSTIVAAHDGKMKADKMQGKNADKTYSGCLQRGEGGSYQLTQVMSMDGAKGKMSDSMKMDDSTMKDASMKADSMKDDSMKHDMAPGTLALSSGKLDLSAHVGHKVTVTGKSSDDMHGTSSFKVTSLKMIAGSCS
jgi:hypothetical protein